MNRGYYRVFRVLGLEVIQRHTFSLLFPSLQLLDGICPVSHVGKPSQTTSTMISFSILQSAGTLSEYYH